MSRRLRLPVQFKFFFSIFSTLLRHREKQKSRGWWCEISHMSYLVFFALHAHLTGDPETLLASRRIDGGNPSDGALFQCSLASVAAAAAVVVVSFHAYSGVSRRHQKVKHNTTDGCRTFSTSVSYTPSNFVTVEEGRVLSRVLF